jgi:hypothetical protein
MNTFADKEWAESFIKQEAKLPELEGTDAHCDLWEDLHEQWVEMDKSTRDLVRASR